MPSLNICHFIGNLTRDPELRVLPKGTSVASFGIAINRDWKDESGQKREEVTFLDLEAWGKTAEIIAKYCTKGRPIYVTARARVDNWDDKTTGQKRSRVKFVVEAMQLLGGRDSTPAASSGTESAAPDASPSAAPAPGANRNINYEDVPF